jgi:hypothetical protein
MAAGDFPIPGWENVREVGDLLRRLPTFTGLMALFDITSLGKPEIRDRVDATQRLSFDERGHAEGREHQEEQGEERKLGHGL